MGITSPMDCYWSLGCFSHWSLLGVLKDCFIRPWSKHHFFLVSDDHQPGYAVLMIGFSIVYHRHIARLQQGSFSGWITLSACPVSPSRKVKACSSLFISDASIFDGTSYPLQGTSTVDIHPSSQDMRCPFDIKAAQPSLHWKNSSLGYVWLYPKLLTCVHWIDTLLSACIILRATQDGCHA